jgi:hypothetical protein
MFDTSLGGVGDRFPRLEAIDAWTLEKATSPAREAVGFVHPLMQRGLRPSNVSVDLCILRELRLSAALHGEYLAPGPGGTRSGSGSLLRRQPDHVVTRRVVMGYREAPLSVWKRACDYLQRSRWEFRLGCARNEVRHCDFRQAWIIKGPMSI